MTDTKVVFTYHAMDRVTQRFPEISQASIHNEVKDPNNWLMTQFDYLSGGNKQDGVKMIVTLKVLGRQLKTTLIKKTEENRPTLIILTVHP